MTTSAADGRPLPTAWDTASPKIEVIRYLQNKTDETPVWWIRSMDIVDRQRVIKHLIAVGSISSVNARTGKPYSFLRPPAYDFRQSRPAAPRPPQAYLYDPPNGGNRCLPSVYTLDWKAWLKANREVVPFEGMNVGHLENCIKLLKESNGNIVGRATSILGKLYNHFRNQPDIQRRLEELCKLMQMVDVDDMYPVFTLLAAELHTRKPLPSTDDWVGPDPALYDDNLSNWMDAK